MILKTIGKIWDTSWIRTHIS